MTWPGTSAWQPDEQAHQCNGCDKPFSLTFRRQYVTSLSQHRYLTSRPAPPFTRAHSFSLTLLSHPLRHPPRSHCRACGFVFCETCSAFNLADPRREHKSVRACRFCHTYVLTNPVKVETLAQGLQRRSTLRVDDAPPDVVYPDCTTPLHAATPQHSTQQYGAQHRAQYGSQYGSQQQQQQQQTAQQ